MGILVHMDRNLVCMLGILAHNVVLESMGCTLADMVVDNMGHTLAHKAVDKVVDSMDHTLVGISSRMGRRSNPPICYSSLS